MTEEPRDFDVVIRNLESGATPAYGDAAERQKRQELLKCLAQLRGAPATAEASARMIPAPHENLQPYLVLNYIISLFGLFPSSGEPRDPVMREAEKAAGEIEAELAKDEPDALAVARSAQRLAQIRDWLLGKGNLAAEEFAKSFGKSLGASAGMVSVAAASGILGPLTKVIGAAAVWLATVTV